MRPPPPPKDSPSLSFLIRPHQTVDEDRAPRPSSPGDTLLPANDTGIHDEEHGAAASISLGDMAVSHPLPSDIPASHNPHVARATASPTTCLPRPTRAPASPTPTSPAPHVQGRHQQVCDSVLLGGFGRALNAVPSKMGWFFLGGAVAYRLWMCNTCATLGLRRLQVPRARKATRAPRGSSGPPRSGGNKGIPVSRYKLQQLRHRFGP